MDQEHHSDYLNIPKAVLRLSETYQESGDLILIYFLITMCDQSRRPLLNEAVGVLIHLALELLNTFWNRFSFLVIK